MQANRNCTVQGCDVSATAVQCFRTIAAEQGIAAERVSAFVHDISQPAAALADASADAVLLVFTLAAMHPDDMISVLQSAARILKPGGKLFVRDHGLYDLTQLRFAPQQRLDEKLYCRCVAHDAVLPWQGLHA